MTAARLQDCPRCGSPLVAVRSRRIGLCAGCTTEADAHPPASGTVEHEPTCTAPRITEHETPRRRVLTCTGCRAFVVLARVNRWRDHG